MSGPHWTIPKGSVAPGKLWPPPKVPGPGRVPAKGLTCPARSAAERRGRREGKPQREREDREREPPDVVLDVARNVPAPMRRRTATLAVLAADRRRLALAAIFGGCSDSKHDEASAAAVPGQPSVEIVSPRNGARQTSHAVVVKAIVENFRLAPRQFGREPQLGEGHIRFSLNRVPDCVDPKKLLDAINSPIGNGRLVGASFDYPALLRPQRRPRRADRQRRQLLARRPGRRSSTTASPPASTA